MAWLTVGQRLRAVSFGGPRGRIDMVVGSVGIGALPLGFRTRNVKGQQMQMTNVLALARHLFETQGAKAIAQAAQKAAGFERAGDEVQAKAWHRVEAVLREMRGPRQS